MSYNIRANEDKNLFIVDDTYDKDYDILAYEKSLAADGVKLYNSEFTSVKEKIGITSQLLNLEVFCDTQGHIRCRSPQYNRMPSSVFYKMMSLKEKMQIQIFPQFLNDLFKSKIQSLKANIELLENQIRLDCAILDKNTDSEAAAFINEGGGASASFAFFSEQNGGITEIDSLIAAANPDSRTNKTDGKAKEVFNKISAVSSSTKDIFTSSKKYLAINQQLNKTKLNVDGTAVIIGEPSFLSEQNERVNSLIKYIAATTKTPINKKDYLYKTEESTIVVRSPRGVDVFKVVNDISDKVRDWQRATKSFFNAIKNSNEFRYLDDNPNAANDLITNGNFRKEETIPEVFEHMIEDETYDDLGPGSGKRYIIKRSQIRSINIGENAPPATTIEVNGILDPSLPNVSNEGFNALSEGGNGYIKAVAVDYDMWRNYGFKSQSVVSAPFLTNPHTQCGPYACMLLSRARKNVLKGSVTISGNEYMQPGEVVYIEDRGLLFYVNSVTHSFTYNSSFQTTLDLSYGHTPGEYIPTPLDMIGKMIYNNKDTADIVVQRQESSNNDISIGVLQLNKNSDEDGGVEKSLGTGKYSKDSPSSFSSANNEVLNSIAFITSTILANNANNSNDLVAQIEMRIYASADETDKVLQKFVEEIIKVLTVNDTGSGTNAISNGRGVPRVKIDKNNIKTNIIILEENGDRNSPSQKAWDAARNIARNNKGPSLRKAISAVGDAVESTISGLFKSSATVKKEADKKANNEIANKQKALKDALYQNIVDCWVTVGTKAAENSKDCK